MSFFAGKVVIVTGSSSGIGRSTAVFFAKEGAKVTITGRKDDALAETKALCVAAGARKEDVLDILGDLKDEKFASRLVEDTVAKFGQLDVLVNNAGAAVFDKAGNKGMDIPATIYDQVMELNVRSVIILTQFATPHLEKTKGAIVNVSSIASMPFVNMEPYYCTSKAALDQLTVQMAGNLIRKGIRVNSVNPGVVETNFSINAGRPAELADKLYKGLGPQIPLGRVGEPDDIAKIILFLADRSQSEIIVGQRIFADGGTVLQNALYSAVPK